MQITGCVLAAALLFCMLKGFVLGFDSLSAASVLRSVLVTDALVIPAVLTVSQANACTQMVIGG